MEQLYGYVGKILKVDLTKREVSYIDTGKYVPKFIGGRGIAAKLFYDEFQDPAIKAFDPENPLMFMTGPSTATGIPTGGRCTFCSIMPNSIPEMFGWSGIAGYFGSALKFAGYDGFVLVGRASEPSYLLIDDDKIQILPAEAVWGKTVHETQDWFFEKYGHDFHSVVIGPAGEHMMRNASITTSADSAAAKGGMGAVMGSKNIKAVVAHGTGDVQAGNLEKLYEVRRTLNEPPMTVNPVKKKTRFGAGLISVDVPQGWDCGWLACSRDCTMRCNMLVMNTKDPFTGETINQVEKCVSPVAYNFSHDYPRAMFGRYYTEKNHPSNSMRFYDRYQMDTSDPYYEELSETYMGDKLDFWGPDYDRGNLTCILCNEYGIDKWDVLIWYLPWLSMCKKEGLLGELDFGMEVDVENPAFIRHFMKLISYRTGPMTRTVIGDLRPIGDILAEGMARATRLLGKEKYADSIYHGRYNLEGKRLDIPVSLEEGWGHSAHWAGRGFEATHKAAWICNSLQLMVSSRDAQTLAHTREKYTDFLQYKDNPSENPMMAKCQLVTDVYGEIKDCLVSCEWALHNPYWPNAEADIFEAATGVHWTAEELFDAGVRVKQLFRAIQMRNFGRDRNMEVEEIYPFLTFPDPWEETVTWDEWNDCVDLYYKELGWDLQTGWPTRETWERYGLKEIADDMEKLGKLPPDGRTAYTRKANPFDR